MKHRADNLIKLLFVMGVTFWIGSVWILQTAEEDALIEARQMEVDAIRNNENIIRAALQERESSVTPPDVPVPYDPGVQPMDAPASRVAPKASRGTPQEGE